MKTNFKIIDLPSVSCNHKDNASQTTKTKAI